tara:strand:+ start:9754 stop:10776 length:1023 start_codon:yes stop_codon:yes gene_type:complete
MKRARGLSLLELMIAMTLGLVVVLGVTTVFLGSKQGYRVQESTSRLQENARFAMDLLSREIRHADFWGGATPAFIRRYSSSLASVGAPCTESWMADVDNAVEAWAGTASSPLAGCTVQNYVPNTDVLVVRFADPAEYMRTAALPDIDGTNGRLILRARVGRDGILFDWRDHAEIVTPAPLVEDGAEPPAPDAPGAFPGDESTGVLTYRLGGRVLFVRTNPAGTPAIYVRQPDSSVSGVSNSTELVEGIEMMRLQFGIDEDGDAVVNRYVSTADMRDTDWASTLIVRAALIVRGDALDDFADDNTYTLPDGYEYTPAAADQRFLRRLFVQDIQLRNRLDRS